MSAFQHCRDWRRRHNGSNTVRRRLFSASYCADRPFNPTREAGATSARADRGSRCLRGKRRQDAEPPAAVGDSVAHRLRLVRRAKCDASHRESVTTVHGVDDGAHRRPPLRRALAAAPGERRERGSQPRRAMDRARRRRIRSQPWPGRDVVAPAATEWSRAARYCGRSAFEGSIRNGLVLDIVERSSLRLGIASYARSAGQARAVGH